jgi:hypothetical protein
MMGRHHKSDFLRRQVPDDYLLLIFALGLESVANGRMMR